MSAKKEKISKIDFTAICFVAGVLVVNYYYKDIVLTIQEYKTNKKANLYKKQIEEEIVKDVKENDVENLDLNYVGVLKEEDDYFLKLTGRALKLDGSSIEFFHTKYLISEEGYNNIQKEAIKGKENVVNPALLKNVLEVIKEAKLVETREVDIFIELSSVENAIIKEISKPKIGEDFIYYDVDLMLVNDKDSKLEVITKRIYYPKNEIISENPYLIYKKDKKEAFIQNISKKTYKLDNVFTKIESITGRGL